MDDEIWWMSGARCRRQAISSSRRSAKLSAQPARAVSVPP
jgi:hypothetical protein